MILKISKPFVLISTSSRQIIIFLLLLFAPTPTPTFCSCSCSYSYSLLLLLLLLLLFALAPAPTPTFCSYPYSYCLLLLPLILLPKWIKLAVAPQTQDFLSHYFCNPMVLVYTLLIFKLKLFHPTVFTVWNTTCKDKEISNLSFTKTKSLRK